jgi:hypothetical protein
LHTSYSAFRADANADHDRGYVGGFQIRAWPDRLRLSSGRSLQFSSMVLRVQRPA